MKQCPRQLCHGSDNKGYRSFEVMLRLLMQLDRVWFSWTWKCFDIEEETKLIFEIRKKLAKSEPLNKLKIACKNTFSHVLYWCW